MGPGVGSFSTFPAIISGYLLGWRGGLLMGPISLVINEGLLAMAGEPVAFTASDLFYAGLTTSIAVSVGWVQGIRIELREAIHASNVDQERYQLVSLATNDVIWDRDLATDKVVWNDKFETTFGGASSEVPADSGAWSERLHVDDRTGILASLDAALKVTTTRQWSGVYRFRRGDGSYAVVRDRAYIRRDAAGHATRMLGSLQDITAQRAAERALQESEAAFRTLFENVPIGLYRTTPSGQIVLANPALLSLLGYGSLEDLQKRDLNKLYEADYERRVFQSLLAEKRIVRNLVSTWTTQDGRKVPVREDVRLVCDDAGAPLYYEGSVEDLTERLRMERDAATQQRALERSEALGALGTLVAGVAHEVNNPLTYIRGNVELVQMGLDDLSQMELPPDARDVVGEMDGKLSIALRGIDQLASIAQSLKVVARRSEGNRTREDIETLAKSVLLVAESRIPTTATVRTEFHSARPVEVVSEQLTQVLLNLVFNSADAVRGRPDGLIVVRTYEDEHSTVIEVTDNGVGIAKEEEAKIFVPFHTTKPEGTGLGLSVSHGLVQSMGGKLTFETVPGRGTTFRVVLPA
jgi:PAS domain S-box-containing protein